METILLVIHLLIALALVGAVLLQRSEGGVLGIGGGGGGGNLFSSRGVGNALTRTTAFLAVAFFITSITLTMLAVRSGGGGSLLDTVQPQGAPAQQGGTANQNVLPDLGPPQPAKPAQPQVPVTP